MTSVDTGARDLWDNAKSWGPFFWCRALPPRRAWPIAISWTREIGKPFRFGWGIRFRGLHQTHSFGIWWHDKKAKPSVAALGPDIVDYEDDEDWKMPPPPHAAKSSRWTWSNLIFNFRIRHKKGQNAFQYVWYTWRGMRLAKKAAKAQKAKELSFQEWHERLIAGEYDIHHG